MSSRIELPVLIAGRRVHPDDATLAVTYDDSTEIVVHRPNAADGAEIAARAAAGALRELSIDDITVFFDRVGRRWMDPGNEWRERAIELGARATGYAPAMVRSDVDYLGHTLERAKQYDFIETDLGDPALLDE
jgi:hypothetical protein